MLPIIVRNLNKGAMQCEVLINVSANASLGICYRVLKSKNYFALRNVHKTILKLLKQHCKLERAKTDGNEKAYFEIYEYQF